MKKIIFAVTAGAAIQFSVIAGGLLTNTNQSVQYTRMQSREGVIAIDGVYYNPAGISFLENGLHLSLGSQYIYQTRTIGSSYSLLNQSEYKGIVNVPVFPTVYAAYVMNNLSFSLGFNPIGGGGSATFEEGLPSFEYAISELPKKLPGVDTNLYNLNIKFDGSSVYYGYQLNLGYKLTEQLSVSAGIRLVSAVESYTGSLSDINVVINGTNTPASMVLQGISTSIGNAADQLQAGDASAVLSDPTLIGILTNAGVYQPGLTNGDAVVMLDIVSAGYLDKAAALEDQEVDVEKTGFGFAPIIGMNYKLSDKLNLSLKYEFKTSIELTTSSKKDLVTPVFTDGLKENKDLPAMLSFGASYYPTDKLLLAVSGRYFFDKNVDWEGREELIDKNAYEISAGSEYNLTDKFLVSAGFSVIQKYPMPEFQTDLSYNLSSLSYAFGFAYRATEKLEFNIGANYTSYAEDKALYTGHDAVLPEDIYQTYDKSVISVGLGIDYKF